MSVIAKNLNNPSIKKASSATTKPSLLPVINTVINRNINTSPLKKEDFGAPMSSPSVVNSAVSDDDDNGKAKASAARTAAVPSLLTFKNAVKAFKVLALAVILIFTSILFNNYLTSGASLVKGACVSKCTLSSDITPVQFLSGVYNITYVCYRGSSQVIYIPPTDPLNYEFGTPSFNAALSVCTKSVKQTFAVQPSIIPYMANDPTGQSEGVYTRCSLVWECSFSYFT